MSEPTGEQPNYGYEADISPNSGMTDDELRRNAEEAPFIRPEPFGDEKGHWDENGLYWFHMPHIPRPAGVDSLKDFVLTDITIEEPPRAEDVEARYQEILASKPPMALPTYSIDPLGYPEPMHPTDPAVNPGVAHREGYNPKKHIQLTSDDEAEPKTIFIKEDVTPADVVDWVRTAHALPTTGGQNIILKDSLSGWEPGNEQPLDESGGDT